MLQQLLKHSNTAAMLLKYFNIAAILLKYSNAATMLLKYFDIAAILLEYSNVATILLEHSNITAMLLEFCAVCGRAFGDRRGPQLCLLAVFQSQYRYPIKWLIGPIHTGAHRCACLCFPVQHQSSPGVEPEWKVVVRRESRAADLIRSLAPITVISVHTQSRFVFLLAN